MALCSLVPFPGMLVTFFFPPLLHVLLMALSHREQTILYLLLSENFECQRGLCEPQEPMFTLVVLYAVLKSLSIVRGKIIVLCCCSVNQMLIFTFSKISYPCAESGFFFFLRSEGLSFAVVFMCVL